METSYLSHTKSLALGSSTLTWPFDNSPQCIWFYWLIWGPSAFTSICIFQHLSENFVTFHFLFVLLPISFLSLFSSTALAQHQILIGTETSQALGFLLCSCCWMSFSQGFHWLIFTYLARLLPSSVWSGKSLKSTPLLHCQEVYLSAFRTFQLSSLMWLLVCCLSWHTYSCFTKL